MAPRSRLNKWLGGTLLRLGLLHHNLSYNRMDIHSQKTAVSDRPRRSGLVATAAGILGLIVGWFLLIPFNPDLPTVGLDSSWAYALNEAVSRGYVFGRDLIYTFGPYASLFTHMYGPTTNTMMMLASSLFATGLCIALGLAIPRRRLFLAVIFPFLLANCFTRDSIFFLYPFALFLAICRISLPEHSPFSLSASPMVLFGIGLSTVAVSLIPLVKGSFAGTTASLCGLGFIVLCLNDVRKGVVFAAIFAVGMSAAWVLAGQPLSQLPYYFIAQWPIITGYTNAMSQHGPLWPAAAYLLTAALLLVAFYMAFVRHSGNSGWAALLGMALTLWVAFKAGFTRQDEHVFVAVETLLFVTFCVCFYANLKSAALISVAVAIASVSIANSIGFSHRRVWSLEGTVEGIRARIMSNDVWPRKFDDANLQIKSSVPLANVHGTVDLYPTELSAIFANGLHWSGRPIIQSYVEYSPALNAQNVAHLRSNRAPQTVFFTLSAIDNRLPSFDDSGSLLELLSGYKIVNYHPPYIQMEKYSTSSMAGLTPSEARTLHAKFQQVIDIGSTDPVWVSLNVEPNRLGQLVASAFKLPRLGITLFLDDGRIINHRFIATIGQTGFILSPYLSSTEDIIFLAAGIQAVPRVKSFKITTNGAWGWLDGFDVHITPIHIALQPTARPLLLSAPTTPPDTLTKRVGDAKIACYIEAVNGQPYDTARPVFALDKVLELRGWTAPKEPAKSIEAWVVLTSASGEKSFFKATSRDRPDVVAAFKRPDLKTAGFRVLLDLGAVTGRQKLSLYSLSGGAAFACPVEMNVE
jgi:hypothetical protein